MACKNKTETWYVQPYFFPKGVGMEDMEKLTKCGAPFRLHNTTQIFRTRWVPLSMDHELECSSSPKLGVTYEREIHLSQRDEYLVIKEGSRYTAIEDFVRYPSYPISTEFKDFFVREFLTQDADSTD